MVNTVQTTLTSTVESFPASDGQTAVSIEVDMCRIPQCNAADMVLATVVCGVALLGQSAALPGTTVKSYDGSEGHRMIVIPGG